jgi:ATP-dependent Clp protease adaptor protein ClpS
MAQEVDDTGRVIVDTTTKERAELKRDQIHAYGADHRLERSKGSMRATIEPAPGPA